MVRAYKRFEDIKGGGAYTWTGARWIPNMRRRGTITQTDWNRLIKRHAVLKGNGEMDYAATESKIQKMLPQPASLKEAAEAYGVKLLKWDKRQGWVPNVKAIQKSLAPQRREYIEQREQGLQRLSRAQKSVGEAIRKVSATEWVPSARQLRLGQKGYVPRLYRKRIGSQISEAKQKETTRLLAEKKKITGYQKRLEKSTPKEVFGF